MRTEKINDWEKSNEICKICKENIYYGQFEWELVGWIPKAIKCGCGIK
jgi:hypothetical protein